MNTLQFLIVLCCAVAGFWLVSFVLEAFGPNASSERAKNESTSEQLRSDKATGREPPWFEVLGVPSAAPISEIKTAYRKLVQQYHPDRLEGLGAELREIAEQKMKQLNAAYQSALRVRGDKQ